jgi:hypothetical protein
VLNHIADRPDRPARLKSRKIVTQKNQNGLFPAHLIKLSFHLIMSALL